MTVNDLKLDIPCAIDFFITYRVHIYSKQDAVRNFAFLSLLKKAVLVAETTNIYIFKPVPFF